MTKLKFYIKNNKKTYTLKDKINNEETKDAHYKFIKIKPVKLSDNQKIKENNWDSLGGIMKHVKKGSVELKHEVSDYLAEKYAKKK